MRNAVRFGTIALLFPLGNTRGLDDLIVPIFGFLPSVIVNTFFGSALRPIIAELCTDFVKQFSLQQTAECSCTGHVTANLELSGQGICRTKQDNLCVVGVCGAGIIYPSVKTERINFLAILTSFDPSKAVDDFDLGATAILNDQLTVDFDAKGSIADCTVKIVEVSAQYLQEKCEIEVVPFVIENPSCENNTKSEKKFRMSCSENGVVDAVFDVAFQSEPGQ